MRLQLVRDKIILNVDDWNSADLLSKLYEKENIPETYILIYKNQCISRTDQLVTLEDTDRARDVAEIAVMKQRPLFNTSLFVLLFNKLKNVV